MYLSPQTERKQGALTPQEISAQHFKDMQALEMVKKTEKKYLKQDDCITLRFDKSLFQGRLSTIVDILKYRGYPKEEIDKALMKYGYKQS